MIQQSYKVKPGLYFLLPNSHLANMLIKYPLKSFTFISPVNVKRFKFLKSVSKISGKIKSIVASPCPQSNTYSCPLVSGASWLQIPRSADAQIPSIKWRSSVGPPCLRFYIRGFNNQESNWLTLQMQNLWIGRADGSIKGSNNVVWAWHLLKWYGLGYFVFWQKTWTLSHWCAFSAVIW